ncbi:MAG: Flp family type IVb pilin [Alphaproteobacteria bacterium]|jgi:pilus assembly protein Flp/PilA
MATPLTKLLKRFAADTKGATAIEYALVAVGVAGTVTAIVYTLGGTIQTRFWGNLNNNFK